MFAPNVKLKDSTQSFEVSVGKHSPSTRYCHGCCKSPFQSVDPDQESNLAAQKTKRKKGKQQWRPLTQTKTQHSQDDKTRAHGIEGRYIVPYGTLGFVCRCCHLWVLFPCAWKVQ